MRITSRGQVTIPAETRMQAGLLPHTEVDFEFDGKTVRIVVPTIGRMLVEDRCSSLVCENRETSP
jgi:bifunctional DNA-binding transcriptional regulator/antitoxin component of YhaV-PrlF toxin-antitoxin module